MRQITIIKNSFTFVAVILLSYHWIFSASASDKNIDGGNVAKTNETKVIEPKLKYHFEYSEEDIKLCEISIVMTNYPKGEGANFKFFSMRNKDGQNNGAIRYGFKIYAGVSEIKNGLPSTPLPYQISEASILSNTFSSVKNMTRIDINNGGLAYVVPSSILESFVLLMMRGDYFIAIKRKSDLTEITYVIREAPPQDIRMKFIDCSSKL